MVLVSQRRISEFLGRADDGETNTDRGRALEDLVCYVFDKIPGISITYRNPVNVFHSEEIDVVLWNDKHPSGFNFLPNIILTECKNWSTPVTSVEVSWFDNKLRSRGLTFGVLVALNGITGRATDRTAAHDIVARALSEGRQMIIVTRQEIENFSSSQEIVLLFKKKLCDLAVVGTAFP